METNPGQRIVGYAATAAVLGLALFVIAARVTTGSMAGLDAITLEWLRGRTGDSGAMIGLAKDVTALGNDVTLWLVSLAALGYLAAGRRWAQVIQLGCTTALGGIATSVLKLVVDRPRPSIVAHLVDVHSASFPSGHAMNSTLVYGTLALLAIRRSSPAQERLLITVALALIVSIGMSRLILGVHWPSDMLAGWAIGAGWTYAAARLFHRRDSASHSSNGGGNLLWSLLRHRPAAASFDHDDEQGKSIRAADDGQLSPSSPS